MTHKSVYNDDDIIRVPAGEEFDYEDNSWMFVTGFKNESIVREAFLICGNRKYFKSQKESRLWHKIDNQVAKGMIPSGWIKNCLDWARSKNGAVCAIKIEALGHLILNKAAMQDWMTENKTNLIVDDDKGYLEVWRG